MIERLLVADHFAELILFATRENDTLSARCVTTLSRSKVTIIDVAIIFG